MTRNEALEEFGLTTEEAGFALDIMDWANREDFVISFIHKFGCGFGKAQEAYTFAQWANRPENIHIFY